MNKITNVWNWLDGKKTAIGTGLLFLSVFLNQVVITQWHYDATWLNNSIATFDWIGGALLGTGVAHKLMKPGTQPAVQPEVNPEVNQEKPQQ